MRGWPLVSSAQPPPNRDGGADKKTPIPYAAGKGREFSISRHETSTFPTFLFLAPDQGAMAVPIAPSLGNFF